MCWLLTYFLVRIQNKLRVICDWEKVCPCLFSGAPAAIFVCTFMKTLFTGTAISNRTLMVFIYIPLKTNLSHDYAVCFFFKDISCFYFKHKCKQTYIHVHAYIHTYIGLHRYIHTKLTFINTTSPHVSSANGVYLRSPATVFRVIVRYGVVL